MQIEQNNSKFCQFGRFKIFPEIWAKYLLAVWAIWRGRKVLVRTAHMIWFKQKTTLHLQIITVGLQYLILFGNILKIPGGSTSLVYLDFWFFSKSDEILAMATYRRVISQCLEL